jgi:glycosyltransferase involved in cell wall biosynthesis
VVFPPVDTSRFEVSSTHQGYFLVVSALTRFKQIDIAVEALSHLPQHRLVIIGDGAERAKLQSLAGRNVEFLGRKSDADTAQFFQNCRAVIFPGLEDFGIVPVEAMASGKPVIAYGKGGVTETVIAEKTGVFFDELSSQSLQDGLTRFFKLEQQGSFDPHVCRARAEEFSEEIFRHKIREAVQTMCG